VASRAALGSGEALNEHVTGDSWPDKEGRDQRLLACVEVIRALLLGEEVSRTGLVEVHRARVWSLPAEPPPLYGAAVSAETAEVVGGWADGLVTVNQPVDTLRDVLAAFRAGGGEGKPAAVQVHLAWNEDEDKALAMAHDQWAFGVLGHDLSWNLEQPEDFDRATRDVAPDDVRRAVLVGSDVGWHRERLLELADVGFDIAYLHPVADQVRCLEVFAEHVRPAVEVAA
jgi:G6PDH family F420-dependent oxidoreductase